MKILRHGMLRTHTYLQKYLVSFLDNKHFHSGYVHMRNFNFILLAQVVEKVKTSHW